MASPPRIPAQTSAAAPSPASSRRRYPAAWVPCRPGECPARRRRAAAQPGGGTEVSAGVSISPGTRSSISPGTGISLGPGTVLSTGGPIPAGGPSSGGKLIHAGRSATGRCGTVGRDPCGLCSPRKVLPAGMPPAPAEPPAGPSGNALSWNALPRNASSWNASYSDASYSDASYSDASYSDASYSDASSSNAISRKASPWNASPRNVTPWKEFRRNASPSNASPKYPPPGDRLSAAGESAAARSLPAAAASGRALGSRCSRASMAGPNAPADRGRGASSFAIMDRTARELPRSSNGPCPSTAAYSVAPRDQRSDAGVAGSPHDRRLVYRESLSCDDAEAAFTIHGQRPGERQAQFRSEAPNIHPHGMAFPVPIHVLIIHPIYRTHVANLCGKVFVELVSEQKNTRGEVRNLNGLCVEPRLQLRVGKRIVDVTELNSDIGIRQESRVLRRLILRRRGGGRLCHQ